MAKGNFPAHRLLVMEKFGVLVAQSIVGGKLTAQNDKRGDLYHRGGGISEVKLSGGSSGAIIVQSQLRHQVANLACHDLYYIIVYYQNRRFEKGKWLYLPMRVGKTKTKLEEFLVEQTREICIIHVSVVDAIFRHREEDLRTYTMQDGQTKTYLKMRGSEFRKFGADVQGLSKLGLDPIRYVSSQRSELARFGKRRIPVTVFRILRKVAGA